MGIRRIFNQAKQVLGAGAGLKRLIGAVALLGAQAALLPLAQAQSADLIMNKTGPTTANNGQVITYVLQIRNAGPNSADGATYNDNLPAGLTNVTAVCQNPTAGAVCAVPSTISNTTVSGAVPTFPSTATVEIAISGQLPVRGPGSFSNTATTAVPSGTIETNASSNASTINTTVSYLPMDIAVTKTQSAAALAVGTQHTYTVTYTNVSGNPADGTQIADTISYSSAALSGALGISGYSASCVSSSGSVSCPAPQPGVSSFPGNSTPSAYLLFQTVPVWPAGVSFTYTYRFTPTSMPCNPGSATTATLNNTATSTAVAPINDSVATNNSAAVTGTLPPIAACTPLPTSKTEALSSLAFGQEQTYTVTYSNPGPGNAAGAYIYDLMQISSATGAVGLVYDTGSAVCVSNSTTPCPVIDMPASGNLYTGQSLWYTQIPDWPAGTTFTITAKVTPRSYLNVPLCSSAGTFTPNLVNQSQVFPLAGSQFSTPPISTVFATLPPIVTPPCALTVTKTQSSAVYSPNVPMTYTMVYQNTGPQVNNYRITDQMDQIVNTAGPLSYTNGSTTCVSNNPSVPCPVSTVAMPATGSATYSTQQLISATVPVWPTGTTFTYTLQMTPRSFPSTCGATGQIPVRNLAYIFDEAGRVVSNSAVINNAICTDMVITKSRSPLGFIPPGGTLTYTLTVTNGGPGPSSGATVRDVLPFGFNYTGSTCTVTTGTAVCGPVGAAAYTAGPLGGNFVSLVPSMNANSVVTYTISGTVSAFSSSWPNAGEVNLTGPGQFEILPGTNISSVNFPINGIDPSIAKTTLTPQVQPGGVADYVIVVSNPASGATLTNMSVVDTLSGGLTYIGTTSLSLSGGATRTGADPVAGATTPTWTGFTVPPGGNLHCGLRRGCRRLMFAAMRRLITPPTLILTLFRGWAARALMTAS